MKLTVDNVSVSIASKKIVEHISLQVNDNQFVGLIGPNGCGKSTLLKSISK
ncbi:ATP-binding cassette domain-containing protein, partial [Carnobacterium sp.]